MIGHRVNQSRAEWIANLRNYIIPIKLVYPSTKSLNVFRSCLLRLFGYRLAGLVEG